MATTAKPWTRYGFSCAFWFLAAALVRAAYLADEIGSSPLFFAPLLDEKESLDSARQLLSTGGFAAEPFFRAPAYSAFLALILAGSGGAWAVAIRFVQHALGAVLAVFAFDLAWRLGPGGRRRAVGAHVAAALVALYPPMIRLESCIVLDALMAILSACFLWFCCRLLLPGGTDGGRGRWFAFGAAIVGAVAALTRPTIVPVIPVAAAFVAWSIPRARRIDRIAVLLTIFAGPAFALTASAVRNYAVAGEALAMPWQGGYNFHKANCDGANGRYLTQSKFEATNETNPTRSIMIQEYTDATGASSSDGTLRYGDVSRYWMSKARTEILDDPLQWLALYLRKLVYMVSAKEIYNFEEFELQKARSPVLRWIPLSFGLLFPAAMLSLALMSRMPPGRRAALGFIWIYVFGWALAIALYYASGRMRMPLAFPLAVLAGASASWIAGVHWSGARIAAAIVAVCIGVSASWGDWWGVRTESMRHADLARMSNAAWASGKYELALTLADQASDARPGYPTIPLLRGQALYGLGRLADAKHAFEDSIAVLPSDAVAPHNLGIILYRQDKNYGKALEAFQEAIRRSPQYHSAIWRSALCSIALKDIKSAEQALEPYTTDENQSEGRYGRAKPLLLRVALTALACAKNDSDAARRELSSAGTEEAQQIREELKSLGLSDCVPDTAG